MYSLIHQRQVFFEKVVTMSSEKRQIFDIKTRQNQSTSIFGSNIHQIPNNQVERSFLNLRDSLMTEGNSISLFDAAADRRENKLQNYFNRNDKYQSNSNIFSTNTQNQNNPFIQTASFGQKTLGGQQSFFNSNENNLTPTRNSGYSQQQQQNLTSHFSNQGDSRLPSSRQNFGSDLYSNNLDSQRVHFRQPDGLYETQTSKTGAAGSYSQGNSTKAVDSLFGGITTKNQNKFSNFVSQKQLFENRSVMIDHLDDSMVYRRDEQKKNSRSTSFLGDTSLLFTSSQNDQAANNYHSSSSQNSYRTNLQNQQVPQSSGSQVLKKGNQYECNQQYQHYSESKVKNYPIEHNSSNSNGYKVSNDFAKKLRQQKSDSQSEFQISTVFDHSQSVQNYQSELSNTNSNSISNPSNQIIYQSNNNNINNGNQNTHTNINKNNNNNNNNNKNNNNKQISETSTIYDQSEMCVKDQDKLSTVGLKGVQSRIQTEESFRYSPSKDTKSSYSTLNLDTILTTEQIPKLNKDEDKQNKKNISDFQKQWDDLDKQPNEYEVQQQQEQLRLLEKAQNNQSGKIDFKSIKLSRTPLQTIDIKQTLSNIDQNAKLEAYGESMQPNEPSKVDSLYSQILQQTSSSKSQTTLLKMQQQQSVEESIKNNELNRNSKDSNLNKQDINIKANQQEKSNNLGDTKNNYNDKINDKNQLKSDINDQKIQLQDIQNDSNQTKSDKSDKKSGQLNKKVEQIDTKQKQEQKSRKIEEKSINQEQEFKNNGLNKQNNEQNDSNIEQSDKNKGQSDKINGQSDKEIGFSDKKNRNSDSKNKQSNIINEQINQKKEKSNNNTKQSPTKQKESKNQNEEKLKANEAQISQSNDNIQEQSKDTFQKQTKLDIESSNGQKNKKENQKLKQNQNLKQEEQKPAVEQENIQIQADKKEVEQEDQLKRTQKPSNSAKQQEQEKNKEKQQINETNIKTNIGIKPKDKNKPTSDMDTNKQLNTDINSTQNSSRGQVDLSEIVSNIRSIKQDLKQKRSNQSTQLQNQGQTSNVSQQNDAASTPSFQLNQNSVEQFSQVEIKQNGLEQIRNDIFSHFKSDSKERQQQYPEQQEISHTSQINDNISISQMNERIPTVKNQAHDNQIKTFKMDVIEEEMRTKNASQEQIEQVQTSNSSPKMNSQQHNMSFNNGDGFENEIQSGEDEMANVNLQQELSIDLIIRYQHLLNDSSNSNLKNLPLDYTKEMVNLAYCILQTVRNCSQIPQDQEQEGEESDQFQEDQF